MILKEKTYKKSRNPNEVRGDETESQMSFYLRRYFGDSSNIFVLNDVYLSVDNESAQIDHLVVTPDEIFIIESKSASGELVIDNNGHWIKRYGSKCYGFPSPIEQAKIQSKILIKNYNKYHCINHPEAKANREKRVISESQITILAAISNGGIIKNDNKELSQSVLKADMVCGLIEKSTKEKQNKSEYDFLIGPLIAKEIGTYFLGASEVCKNAKFGKRVTKEYGRFHEIIENQKIKFIREIKNDFLDGFSIEDGMTRWMQDDYFFVDILTMMTESIVQSNDLLFLEPMCHLVAYQNLDKRVSDHLEVYRIKRKEMVRKIWRENMISGKISAPKVIRHRNIDDNNK